MTVTLMGSLDPERAGNFLATVLWWDALPIEEKRRVSEMYGEEYVDDVVGSRPVVSGGRGHRRQRADRSAQAAPVQPEG